MRGAILLVLAVVLAGCTPPWGSWSTPIDPAVIRRADVVAQSLQDGHMAVDLDLRHPLLADHLDLELWRARPDRTRVEILGSDQVAFQGLIAASVGSQGWTFRPRNPDSGQPRVDEGPTDTVKPALVYDATLSLLGLLFPASSRNVVSAWQDYVNTTGAIRLELPQASGKCLLWLAATSLLPLKVDCDDPVAGHYTATIHDATYNLGLTDELFDLTFLPTRSYTVRRLP
jgi:hypothetical protein